MQMIHKYKLAVDPQQVITAPMQAIVRSLDVIDGEICLYMEVDTTKPLCEYTLTTVPAGVRIDPRNGDYIGRYILPAEFSPLARKCTVGHVYLLADF